MGIPELWKKIGDGDVEALADIATNHWRTHNRPFRLAMDEAGWRFNNLTAFQVEKIREKSDPRANPIEKAILWRVLGLLRLGIQPVFVFDGPGRPWKHGSGAGKIDYNRTRLLRRLLANLKIRYHEAPGEAEAECARFQEQGIVDAVWSDDGDTLMFGATVLIRSFKDENSTAAKSKTHVRVYRAEKIKQKFKLDRSSLVLFSLLAGGDYNEKGLEGCGAGTAFAAVRWQDGRLGKMLATADLKDLSPFTAQLAEYFQRHSRSRVHVPSNFPRDLHVRHYRDPKVTEGLDKMQDQAEKLARSWDAEIDEGKLRDFLRESFDIQTKEYIKHIVPVLLVSRIIKTSTLDLEARKQLEIKLVHRRGKTADDYKLERLLTCNPLACSSLDLRTRPQDLEDWTKHTDKKTGEKWDPGEHVEIDMLDLFLERALGSVEMARLKEEASKPKTRKRKNAAGGNDEGGPDGSGDGNIEHATEASGPATKRRKSDKAASTDVGSNIQSETGPANTKRKRQSEKDAVQAKQVQSPELGESPLKLHNPSAKPNSAKPSTKKRKSKELSDGERGEVHEAVKVQPAVFRLPTAMQNSTADQRRVLHQEGVQVWHLDEAGEGPSTLTDKLPATSKPRHAPPLAGFDRVIRTEPVQFNGSSSLAALASARLNVSAIASSPPLPSSSTTRVGSWTSVPKPAPATRVDSGTEVVDLCVNEQDGIQSGVIGPTLSSQNNKDRRFAEHEAEIRKRIAEHETDYKWKEFDETVRRTVHQNLDRCRTSLLKLLSDGAVNTMNKLNDHLPPGGSSTSLQEQKLVHDQVVQFRAALARHLGAMRGPFSEACALESKFHGDTRNTASASPPPLTDPTDKTDLAVMKFALGVDIDLETKMTRLSSYKKGPKSGRGTPHSALLQPGASDDDTFSMTDETPSKFSRTVSLNPIVDQSRNSISPSYDDVLGQGNQTDTRNRDGKGDNEATAEITQRSTRRNGSAGLVKPNNWARVVERAGLLQTNASSAATASKPAEINLGANNTNTTEKLDNRRNAAASFHKRNQASRAASTSATAQPIIYDIGDDDTDEDGEAGQFDDNQIQEALRRSKQDQFATAYSSTFASTSRAAYPSLSITSKAQRTELSESPYPVSEHNTAYANAEVEQSRPYAGKGKAPMYPLNYSEEASSNDMADASVQLLSASASVPASAPVPAQSSSAALTRSPTLPPAPTWACINKPHNRPQVSSSAALPSSDAQKNAQPVSSVTAPTPSKALAPVSATVTKQTSLPRSPPGTTNSGKATGVYSREDIAAARVAHFKDVIKNVLPSSSARTVAPNTAARKVVVQPREVIDLCEETTEEMTAAAKVRNREKERRRKEKRASLGNGMDKGKGVCIDLTLD